MSREHSAVWSDVFGLVMAVAMKLPVESRPIEHALMLDRMEEYLRLHGRFVPEPPVTPIVDLELLKHGTETLRAEVQAMAPHFVSMEQGLYETYLSEYAARARLLISEGADLNAIKPVIRTLGLAIDAKAPTAYVRGISRSDEAPWRALIAGARASRTAILARLIANAPTLPEGAIVGDRLQHQTVSSIDIPRVRAAVGVNWKLAIAARPEDHADVVRYLDEVGHVDALLSDARDLAGVLHGLTVDVKAVIVLAYQSPVEWDALRSEASRRGVPVIPALTDHPQRLRDALFALENRLVEREQRASTAT